MRSGLQILNQESVELRKAHDCAIKDLEIFKDENRRLTEQLLKVKESQMDGMDEWQMEFEKLRLMNKKRESMNSNTNQPSDQKITSPVSHSSSSSISPNFVKKKGWSISSAFRSILGNEEIPSKTSNNSIGNKNDYFDNNYNSGQNVVLNCVSLFNASPPQLVCK